MSTQIKRQTRTMLFFLKSLSTTVHHYQEEKEKSQEEEEDVNIEAAPSISLTVWRKSLLFNCSGFTVFGPDGSLAYRVDNYARRPHQFILMDGFGNPIFTVCRPKKLLKQLVNKSWLIYEGEVDKNFKSKSSWTKSHQPVMFVRKNMMMNITRTRSNVLAHVYHGRCRYTVEGSYMHRSCKILDESRRVVGEIKQKAPASSARGASFGSEVFELVLRQGFGSNFGMAIVLLLDQMS